MTDDIRADSFLIKAIASPICVNGKGRTGLITLGTLNFDQSASVGVIAFLIAFIIKASICQKIHLSRRSRRILPESRRMDGCR